MILRTLFLKIIPNKLCFLESLDSSSLNSTLLVHVADCWQIFDAPISAQPFLTFLLASLSTYSTDQAASFPASININLANLSARTMTEFSHNKTSILALHSPYEPTLRCPTWGFYVYRTTYNDQRLWEKYTNFINKSIEYELDFAAGVPELMRKIKWRHFAENPDPQRL
jgi:hypothetical protein